MSHIAVDLINLYQRFFGKPYTVPENWELIEADRRTINGIPISIRTSAGIEVFLPISLWVSKDLFIRVDCATIRVTSKKTIIKTALSERKGTVKRQFNTGDYVFNIKGVLIGDKRQFPDDQIRMLKEIYESDQPVFLFNAFAEIFMPNCRVVVENYEFPEVEGKSLQHRPFTLTCESDFIQTLTLAD